MKKILLTAILAGGTLIGANAGDFILNLPGFFLKINDGPRREAPARPGIHCKKPCHKKQNYIVFEKKPIPPPRHHAKHPPKPPKHR